MDVEITRTLPPALALMVKDKQNPQDMRSLAWDKNVDTHGWDLSSRAVVSNRGLVTEPE